MPSVPITVKPVSNKADLRIFINLPNRLYRGDPNCVPRLFIERQKHFADTNPFFQHAIWQAWIAYKDGRPVGRISAQIDDLYRERHRSATGYFGSLEGENEPDIFEALLDTTESWLQKKGMEQVVGPLNLNINQEVGLLVQGFGTRPYFMMGHAHPYFSEQIERLGYKKAVDTLAFRLDIGSYIMPQIIRACLERNDGLHVRSVRKKNAVAELKILRDIFNDSWSENWGFVPFTEAEFLSLGRDMINIINEDHIKIVEFKNEPAAFFVLFPNFNDAIADLKGRLLPFGWLKLLWRIKIQGIKTARVMLMGVRKKYQSKTIGATMISHLINEIHKCCLKDDVHEVEFSWVLEANRRIRRFIETTGAEVCKTYRIYEKQLSNNTKS